MSVRFPDLQIFVEIFCTNLQSHRTQYGAAICWCTSKGHQNGDRILA